MTDIIYWVWLAEKNGAGQTDAIKLLEYFPGGAKEIYEATPAELSSCRDVNKRFIERLGDHDLSRAERILEFCFMNGIRVIPCTSPNYPKRLQALFNKPILIYARGIIKDLDERFCVSIVGTRTMSSYGKHMAFTLARQLIAHGAIIISGAAYGVDSAANNTAVFMEEPTVAVLGTGVNVPYPASNKEMLDWIGTNGMVISEFEPNTPPYGRNFPIRNRIISGLADAIVVVEGNARSGSLITARCAADQDRRVYAVPGNVGAPNSVGPNNLIRDGAKLVTCAEDILEDFRDRFDLGKVDRIVNSDKYVRYEYNHSIPVQADNKPLTPSQQDKLAPIKVPPIHKASNAKKFPDVPEPTDYRKADKRITAKKISEQDVEVRVEVDTKERERILACLDDMQKRVLDAIPSGMSATTDSIAQTGIPTEEVLASLTMLELYSAVEALPGGLYRKLI